MRVSLGGKGEPRDEFALEGSGVDTSGEAPIVLLMENGEVFHPEDYISLGYTHCEVWCVGASGGRGGDLPTQYGGNMQGGAGGGGGLHRVTVELADLPADCPVVVGQAGIDGTNDNEQKPFLYVLNADGYIQIPSDFYQNPAWVAATDGTDGGASSFNGTTCRASGGKAGKAVKISTPLMLGVSEPKQITYKRWGGDGGAGGRGDSIVAGGGGAGGYSDPVIDPVFHPSYVSYWTPHKPKDGAWDGDIGEGGGGGMGGFVRYSVQNILEGV